ncbi:hypothetical protein D3C73_796030 [compost metagenome]
MHVAGIPGKGHRQVVDLHVGGGLDVDAIFLGQRRRRKPAALAIDALVVRQRTADQHLAEQLTGLDIQHLEFDTPVIQQQDVVGAAVADQCFVINADALLVTCVFIHPGI